MLPLELFKGEVNCWRNCLGFPPFLLRALRRGRKRACILNVRIFWECWPLVLASRSSVSYIKQIGFLEETFFFFVLFYSSGRLTCISTGVSSLLLSVLSVGRERSR